VELRTLKASHPADRGMEHRHISLTALRRSYIPPSLSGQVDFVILVVCDSMRAENSSLVRDLVWVQAMADALLFPDFRVVESQLFSSHPLARRFTGCSQGF
jgi:hypothetical protein